MQPIILPLGALALLGVAGTPLSPAAIAALPDTVLPDTGLPDTAMPAAQPQAPHDEQCLDRITLARGASGKPPVLEREPASPEKPYRIYAVDKRVDGCAVMVMHGDVTDIRPLPARPGSPILLMPAKSAQ